MSLQHDKKNDIVLVGEIVVDIIQTKDTIIEVCGGSPTNISINLKQLGFDPLLCASYGSDLYGEIIENKLDKFDLNKTLIQKINSKTSTVHINQTSETPEPIFNRNADFRIQESNQLKTYIEQSKILHLSYWTLTHNPLKDTVKELIQLAKQSNTIIGFDPNYHDDLVEEHDTKLLFEVLRSCDICKPSLDDSMRIFKKYMKPEEYLDEYQKLGIKLIVLSLGKEGVLVRYDNITTHLPSVATKVVDATGAGDAFWSGLYSGLLKKKPLKDSLNIGLICSAINLQSVGSLSELPHINDLETKEF